MPAEKKLKYTALVVVDETKQTETAFKWYVDNCYQRGHRVILIQGIQAPTVYGMTDHFVHEAIITDLKNQSYDLQEKYAAMLKKKRIHGKFMAKIDSAPTQWITKFAKENKVNLIVMGGKGFDTLTKSIMSSVSNCLIEQGSEVVAVYPGNHVLLPREGQTPAIMI